MPKVLDLTPAVGEYLAAHSAPISAAGQRLIEETNRLFPDVSRMQVDPLQGVLLAWLVKLIRPTRVLEIGTFTGLSSLCMAEALDEGGEVVCCDISEEYTAPARQAWEEAGVADRITLILGPALQTLADLSGSFDLAFLDADKPNYPHYLKHLTRLVRPGGVIVADNTLWSGRVADPTNRDEPTEGLRSFNRMVATHPELEPVLLPLADGITLILRT